MSLLDSEYILRVLLVFVRVSGLLLAAPVFRQQTIPVRVRVLAGVVLAYSLAGFATGPLPEHVTHDVGFILVVLVEAGTGLVMGFTARIIFWAMSFAGTIMGYQMALSLAQTYNPISGTSSNPLGQILSYAFLLAFLLADGHHFLLRALAQSFEVVPLGGATLAAVGPPLLEWMGDFFRLAVRLAAPFLVILFLTDIALGIFARLVPQANLFTLSLPAKLLVGIGIFFAFIQGVFPFFPSLFGQIEQMVHEVLRVIAPG
ncbi:MAG: flagellar biosynthetic protein FliR [Salinibacter sp.]|uniref:flagellar biosynthetic protein FliR n=1 Tax=Salinibacter sp. TaxID=2065818 RepID=UPI002FC32361